MSIIKGLLNLIIIFLCGMGYWVQSKVFAELIGYEWITWQRVMSTIIVCAIIAVYLSSGQTKIIIRDRK